MGTSTGGNYCTGRDSGRGGVPARCSQRGCCSSSELPASSFFRRSGVPSRGGQSSGGAQPGGCGYTNTTLDHS